MFFGAAGGSSLHSVLSPHFSFPSNQRCEVCRAAPCVEKEEEGEMSVRLNGCFPFCSDSGAALFPRPSFTSPTARQIIRACTCCLAALVRGAAAAGGTNAHFLRCGTAERSLCHIHSASVFLIFSLRRRRRRDRFCRGEMQICCRLTQEIAGGA